MKQNDSSGENQGDMKKMKRYIKRKKLLFYFVGIVLCSIALAQTVNASSEHISFHIDAYVADGYFSTDVTSSGNTVKPGEKTTITFKAQKGDGSLYVDLGSYGSQSISFDTPLSSISIPVGGVSGLASVNVDLSGSLEGDLIIDGPATLSKNHLSWTNWGEQTVTVDASNAEDGDTIKVTLDLKYTGHIGAHGDTVLGDVTLISSQSLPGASGSKSFVHTVNVKSSILPSVPGFELISLVSAFALILFWKRKRK